MDSWAKMRSRLYKKDLESGTHSDWSEYMRINKKVKQGARRARTESCVHFMDQLEQCNASERLKLAAACLKAKEGNLRRNKPSTRRIEPEQLTHFIASQFKSLGSVNNGLRIFQTSHSLEHKICKAIRKAPKGKARREDLVFMEVLQTAPIEGAELLADFWKACGRVGAMSRQ